MRRVASVDGALFGVDGADGIGAARVSVFDRGFLYGESVFEVMRTYGGRAVLAPEHVARLRRGCEALELALPLSDEALVAEVSALVARAELGPGEEAVLRVIVTGGRGAGLSRPSGAVPAGGARILVVEPLVKDEARWCAGIDALLLPRVRPPVPGIKTGSYLASVLARRAAEREGADEAIFVEDACLVEGAGSNVFAVSGRVLWTAPDRDGVLPGLTRAHVARFAADSGLTLRWAAPPEAGPWDEIFVTSAVRGVVPIKRLARRTQGEAISFEGAAFPVALELRRALCESLSAHEDGRAKVARE